MNLQFPDENNNIKFDDNFSSSKKDINKNLQNEYLIKYQKLYGDSFSEIELIDIFEKDNYNDEKIINDINQLLLMENKKFDNENNTIEKHYSPSFAHNSNSKNSIMNNKYDKSDKINLQKDSEIPSDYGPPPKNEENNIKIINNNVLLEYKKNLFNKLRTANNTYKCNRNKIDELNFDDIIKGKTEYNMKDNKLIEFDKNNKNYNNINVSPNPNSQTLQIKQANNINKDQKKEYIKIFFGNMKNYSKKQINNIKRENFGKSPNFGKRKNILDMSPDKNEFYEQKVLTYKKGMRNYYSKKRKSYNYQYLKINYKVNDIFISACYDNPQREQFLKIFNAKRKENPDKVIEIIIPQIPSMPSIPFYSNIYPPYNQFNPYMNMYMMPPIQYPSQTNLNSQIMGNNQFNNNSQNIQNINNNMGIPLNSSQTPNSLNNTEILQLNNNQINQINQINQLNNNSNANSFLINNIGIHNYSNNKSSGNVSTSGIINTTSSFK